MESFALEAVKWGPHRNHNQDFDHLVQYVNPVNHGEFEDAANKVLEHASYGDNKTPERPSSLAIQRCRRGGKTFMLHAVASRLTTRVDHDTHVIFITMNNTTTYDEDENALQAILGRIAYEYSGAELNDDDFDDFRESFTDFAAVGKWVKRNKIILIIDELNVVEPRDDDGSYKKMSKFLNDLVGRQGSALLYSTHLRDTSDLLRNRIAEKNSAVDLLLRSHEWVAIPRIVNECCLRGLRPEHECQPSFWSAVLKGRLPALLLQPQTVLNTYSNGIFPLETTSAEDRIKALQAVITGDISQLSTHRTLFKAYSYMSERFKSQYSKQSLFAWPPFLVAQYNVLGKDCGSLRTTLEDPSIEEAKAFEALTQLAVLVRLLSAEHHHLVPHNKDVPFGRSFAATDIFHVSNNATTVEDVISAVTFEFRLRPDILQVVAVPYSASFPRYDFFVMHRKAGGWMIAAGYQCKQGTERPIEDADPTIPLSVWIEGKCRKYRVDRSGSHVARTTFRHWVLLGESAQASSMLGVSVSEALPMQHPPLLTVDRKCSAEMLWAEKQAALTASGSPGLQQAQPPAKRTRHSC